MTTKKCQRYLSEVRLKFFFIVLVILLGNSSSMGEEHDTDNLYTKTENVYTHTHSTRKHVISDRMLLHKNDPDVIDVVRPAKIKQQTQEDDEIISSTITSQVMLELASVDRVIQLIINESTPRMKDDITTSFNLDFMETNISTTSPQTTTTSKTDESLLILNESTPSMKDDLSTPFTSNFMETNTTTTTSPLQTTTTKTYVTSTKKSYSTIKNATTTEAMTVTEQGEVTTEQFEIIDYKDENLCGVRPLVKSGRIVGGKDAKFGEWPWQVLVRESTWMGLFIKNKCGGVLITNRFVATAAHCKPGFLAHLITVFGKSDLSKDAEPRRSITINVERVIIHQKYDAVTYENDLALLELQTPVQFDAHIVPICLPQDETDFTGRIGTVTGWGRLTYNGIVPSILQEVQVPVIDNSACQEMIHTAGYTRKILDSFICAGYTNGVMDSCEGDSGGPLVVQRDDGKWELVGTVSVGIKCAAPYLPGLYMRTTYYNSWLKNITGVL